MVRDALLTLHGLGYREAANAALLALDDLEREASETRGEVKALRQLLNAERGKIAAFEAEALSGKPDVRAKDET